MKKVFSLLVVLLWIGHAVGLEPANDPNLAVVRIKSHGASGTIIATTDGKSWILSCCHMFYGGGDHIDPSLVNKKIVMDGPSQPYAKRQAAESRVIATDPNADLSIIEIDNGPFNFVPVAPQGFKEGRNLASVGYDEMKWPVTNRQATILIEMSDWTYTREKPWHGRSGGGLIDVDGKCLIGVVNGYEVTGQQRGIYASHDSILRFINRHRGRIQPTPVRPPEPVRGFRYSAPPMIEFRTTPVYQNPCPGGICPQCPTCPSCPGGFCPIKR
jgi:hypothetical protein